MASLRQIEANQKNAAKSTGPISVEGKSVVGRNAIKHGILSARTYVENEEKELYDEFCEKLINSLNPRGGFEIFLVDRVVSTAWRLRRVIHVEALLFNEAKGFLCEDSCCNAFTGYSAKSMTTLSRYERSLENSLYRAIRELNRFRGQEEIEVSEVSVRDL